MDLGPTQSMIGADLRLLRSMIILLGLSITTLLVAILLS
jgi:hypothetical protein